MRDKPKKKRLSPRMVQVAQNVRQSVARMIMEGSIKDPRISRGMVTLTDVEMTPDLKQAKVYFSVFPEDADVVKDVLDGLKAASGLIRRELGHRLGMKYTPSLLFFFDGSVVEGARMETLIREVRADDDRKD